VREPRFVRCGGAEMAALGWLVAMIAAAGALALPFARGGQFVLALTPFSNAYGAAGATALVLLRWALFEMPGRSISRGATTIEALDETFPLIPVTM